MSILELIFIGLSISADSFAASVLIGIKEKKMSLRSSSLIATIFAFFQAMMPVLGYLLINIFAKYLMKIDHYIAFIFLIYLGVNMIRSRDNETLDGLKIISIIILAISVTIDAFAVGITYNMLHVSLLFTIVINFSITFITTLIGINLGAALGSIVKRKANVIGGLILIIIAFKILLTHLNFI